MIDLSDVPGVGRLLTLLGAVADLLLNSGEFVFVFVEFLLSNMGLLTAILRTLESLANRIPLLPAGIFDDLLTAALVAFLVIEIARLGEAAVKTDS